MSQRVYVETSIISHLVARPSRDLVIAGNQERTHWWWTTHRPRFEIFISEAVVLEIARGDRDAARRRAAIITDLPILEVDEPVRDLARRVMRAAGIPKRAELDAIHVAVATANGMDYLLSWNLKHIAGAEVRGRIEEACRAAGYHPPALSTPADFVGDS